LEKLISAILTGDGENVDPELLLELVKNLPKEDEVRKFRNRLEEYGYTTFDELFNLKKPYTL